MSMAMPAGQVTQTGIGGQPSQADLQAAALARLNAMTGNQNPVRENPIGVAPSAEPMHGVDPAGFGGGVGAIPGGPPGGVPNPAHNPIGQPFMGGGQPPGIFPPGPGVPGSNMPPGPGGLLPPPPVGGPPPGSELPPPLLAALRMAAQRKIGQ